MWVEFVVGSPPCSERFFSGYSGFPLSSKTNTSKFQFDQHQVGEEPLCRCATSKSLFIYLLCFLFAALKPDHIPLANLQIIDHQTSLSDHDRPSDPTQNQTTIDHRQTRPPNQITPPDITDHQPWLLGFQSAQHTQPFELVQVRCILHGLGQGGYIELWMNLAKHTFHTLSALRLRNSFFSALLNCS